LVDIESLEPWGRGFELPVFCDTFEVHRIKPVGDGTHLRLEMADVSGAKWNAIWFRAIQPGQTPPIECGKVRLVYRLQRPGPRSSQTVEIHVQAASMLIDAAS
jgi:single-stranded-DNA-specific exonuclease